MKLLLSLSSLVVAALVVTVTLTACGNKNTNMVVSSATPVGLYATSLVAFRSMSGNPTFRGYSTFAWGFNGNGQLGLGSNNTISPSYTPIGVSMLSGMRGMDGVAVGGSHCLAFRNLSTVWAWGNNYSGQLGTGLINTTTINTVATSVPFQVINATTSWYLTRVTAISAGGNHSLALTSDGTVWSWGGNYSGQLGDATPSTVTTLNNRSVAVQVQKDSTIGNFLTGVTKISAGGSHNLALKSDGTVVAWGLNNYGQLGNNTSPLTTPVVLYSTVPVPVFKNISGTTNITPLPNVIAIAAGGSHSLALDSSGDVWAWGLNSVGQLGTGTFEPIIPTAHALAVKVWDHNKVYPPLIAPSIVSQISAGLDHSLVLLPDGSVFAWGSNFFGQLGHGDPLKGTPANPAAAYPTPVQILTLVNTADPTSLTPLRNIRSIVAIGTHNLAQDSGKRWWAWGENAYGQLGIGSNLDGTPIIDQKIAVKVTGFP
jgi:alpha-tubulin suppressor-like RCC1 family protein